MTQPGTLEQNDWLDPTFTNEIKASSIVWLLMAVLLQTMQSLSPGLA